MVSGETEVNGEGIVNGALDSVDKAALELDESVQGSVLQNGS